VITGETWLKAMHTLDRIAELGKREGVIFCLENLNTAIDHPGTPFARAADTLALVAAIDNPHLGANAGHRPSPDRRGQPS
jgi:hydroxypyruvate isomerase